MWLCVLTTLGFDNCTCIFALAQEDLRDEIKRRSRTDSVVLARSNSSVSSSSSGAPSRSSSSGSADLEVKVGDSQQTTANSFRLKRAGMVRPHLFPASTFSKHNTQP